MNFARYQELLAAGPTITRADRKMLRGFVLKPRLLTIAVLMAFYR